MEVRNKSLKLDEINLEIPDTTMGNRLKLIRTFMGLNQKQFAAELGVYPARISDMENGVRKVSVKIVGYLAQKGVDINWFVNGIRKKSETSLKTNIALLQISSMLHSKELSETQIVYIHDMIDLYLKSFVVDK